MYLDNVLSTLLFKFETTKTAVFAGNAQIAAGSLLPRHAIGADFRRSQKITPVFKFALNKYI